MMFLMNIAERVVLSPEEEVVINRWTHGKSFSVRLVQRAKIIRVSADGMFNHDIAQQLGVSRPTVQLWRERFLVLRLPGLEKDAPRRGRIPRIRQQKITAIINATLHTTPANATHWSTRILTKG